MSIKKDHSIGEGTGAAAGAVTGAAIGSVAGPVGTVVGAVAGGAVGAKAGGSIAEAVNPTEYNEYFEAFLRHLEPVTAVAVRFERRLEGRAAERTLDAQHRARRQLRAGRLRQHQERPRRAFRRGGAQQLGLESEGFGWLRHGSEYRRR